MNIQKIEGRRPSLFSSVVRAHVLMGVPLDLSFCFSFRSFSLSLGEPFYCLMAKHGAPLRAIGSPRILPSGRGFVVPSDLFFRRFFGSIFFAAKLNAVRLYKEFQSS